MDRDVLTDAQWARLQPLLPPRKPAVGRPAHDHRAILNGITWVLRTGSPWRDTPRCYGKWQTVASRFYRWRRKGVWERVLRQLQAEADADGEFDWTLHYVDGSVIRAHQHAAGARGTPQKGGRPKRSVAAKEAFPPRCTCVPRDKVVPSASC